MHFLCDKGAKRRVAEKILRDSSKRRITPVEMNFAEKYSPKIEEIKNNQAKIINSAEEKIVDSTENKSPNESINNTKKITRRKRKKIIIPLIIIAAVLVQLLIAVIINIDWIIWII